MYRLFVPSQAAGTSVVFFDLFNGAGSAANIEILSVQPVVSGAVAVVGVIGVDIFLTRTSAIGTGGTAATLEGTALTACTISGRSIQQTLNPAITARLTPSGGATAGAVLAWASLSTEETNAGSYVPCDDLVRHFPDTPGVIVKIGSGIRVVQNAIASVGNIGFNVSFRVLPL